MSKHFADIGKQKLPFKRNKQAGGGAAICRAWLGVRRRRQDKRHCVEERQKIILTND